ncbi:hypothetical protein TNCV_1088901 [Trichonephila clavipes]|uniref:Uncharacterized protein n=1 Tax=Trichonephila clavipes TaxID=2585209 RepID=A0A8X6SNR6_TRICX|nr:hypothetical protein TNCV_1088901 [Trichonephila clavipes]
MSDSHYEATLMAIGNVLDDFGPWSSEEEDLCRDGPTRPRASSSEWGSYLVLKSASCLTTYAAYCLPKSVERGSYIYTRATICTAPQEVLRRHWIPTVHTTLLQRKNLEPGQI